MEEEPTQYGCSWPSLTPHAAWLEWGRNDSVAPEPPEQLETVAPAVGERGNGKGGEHGCIGLQVSGAAALLWLVRK